MLLNACAGGGRFAGPAELTAAQYARVSTQAHVVLSLGVLASTLAFGSHALLVVGAHSDDAEKAWIAGIVDRYPRVCRMQAPHAPYTASGCSLLLSGLYLLLRVLALCNSCVTSGFVWRDVVQRQHLAISASLLCAGSVELLHGVALRQEAQPGGDSSGSMAARLRKRCAAFGSEWTHDIWFIHVMATALIFLGHPQADAHHALIHVVVGLSLLLGAHAVVVEKKSQFGAAAREPARARQPRCLVPAAGGFMAATISLAAYNEEVVGGDSAPHMGHAMECNVVGRALAGVAGLTTGMTALHGELRCAQFTPRLL
jgi:hypothetical protein